nr:GNAT family N-acetyltransferase [Ornithinimicrobium sp. F0845]
MREWQHPDAPFQLHPGDVGWFWRTGAETTAAAIRTWTRDGRTVAVGLLDGADLLRLAIAPDLQQDEALAGQVVADVSQPDRGVLPEGTVYVESPVGALVQDALGRAGWPADEPWTLLRRDLSTPVEDAGLRVEVVRPQRASAWTAVHKAAFGTQLSHEQITERWHGLASGPAFADARCLLGLDERGNEVAAVIVWSAGPGRCGLIEPMGAHPEHRGHGHGRAITVAAAAALQEMGAAAAVVGTQSSNVGGVATYRSGGYQEIAQRLDRRRDRPADGE